MSTILESDTKPETNIYGTNEKEIKILFTFFFVLFFVNFGRNILLNKEVEPYEVIVMTILVVLWYGLSLVFGS